MVERWSDGAALEAHGAGETFNQLSRSVQEDLAAPLDVQIVEPIRLGDGTKGAIG